MLVAEGPHTLRCERFLIVAGLTIGRGDACTVQLHDGTASREHARIELAPESTERYVLRDCGSRHGTHVNGQLLHAEHKLAPGDVILIGEAVLLYCANFESAEALDVPALGLVGSSWLRRASELSARFGPVDLPVLVIGETGTGKEGFVSLLHAASRRQGTLVAINCAAIPRELAEAQLFGYRKGAFSGALAQSEGLFGAAAQGTLFLDEVADLSLDLQAKLLRVLETRDYIPLGATTPVRSTARIVAAASHDLRVDVESKRFRTDLYHRLAGLVVQVPPLRTRREELVYLLREFLSQTTTSSGISAAALEFLLRYPYPGNVRELRRIVLAASLRASDRGELVIEVEDLELDGVPVRAASSRQMAVSAQVAPRAPGSHSPTIPPPPVRADAAAAEPIKIAVKSEKLKLSREELLTALARADGKISRAATQLGAHRTQVYRAMREHGISADEFRDD